jgi:hypothetical protein
LVFFKVDQDPEIFELLGDLFKRNIKQLKPAEMLEIIVNFSHSLSTEAPGLFDAVNTEFIDRLDTNFNATTREVYI